VAYFETPSRKGTVGTPDREVRVGRIWTDLWEHSGGYIHRAEAASRFAIVSDHVDFGMYTSDIALPVLFPETMTPAR